MAGSISSFATGRCDEKRKSLRGDPSTPRTLLSMTESQSNARDSLGDSWYNRIADYILSEDLFVTTKAKVAGLSAGRLETLDRFIQSKYIDSGKIPGALTVIAR
jgi:hypothetical protein